jgi:hypothetical protein
VGGPAAGREPGEGPGRGEACGGRGGAEYGSAVVSALTSPEAEHKTLELVAERGPAPDERDPLFGGLVADLAGSLDAALDEDNMPLDDEPPSVRDDLAAVRPD